ncbi:MAG: hypothetical protein IT435_15765 [Phycisphaerales bacterium]|nr:hypothetical protein [Phycisphaerales bacterium]
MLIGPGTRAILLTHRDGLGINRMVLGPLSCSTNRASHTSRFQKIGEVSAPKRVDAPAIIA